jgi:nicotinate-nucleotide pyrophosphorylase (carboxylating)
MIHRPLPEARTMTMFSPAETVACRRLIELALEEDLGSKGDLTSQVVIPANLPGKAVFVCRAEGVVAGLPAAGLVFSSLSNETSPGRLTFTPHVADGSPVTRGQTLAIVQGPMRGILAGERTALNFLQHLSGIATTTRRYVDAIADLKCRLLDTRKTLPGWRLLQKHAVRMGGGHNHRLGLYDGILIKDNHLAALRIADHGVRIHEAVQRARAPQSATRHPQLELEVDSLEQLDEALRCRPDIILLDNMTLEQMSEAVKRRDQQAPGVLLEASGGVTLETLRAVAETGVDRISVGALTHSVKALDIGLDYETP